MTFRIKKLLLEVCQAFPVVPQSTSENLLRVFNDNERPALLPQSCLKRLLLGILMTYFKAGEVIWDYKILLSIKDNLLA